MRNPIYFPAIGCTTTVYLGRSDEDLMDSVITKSPRFYNKDHDPYFLHPYALVSAAHHYRNYPDLRTNLGTGDALLFIDSGGYQLATGTVSEKNYNNKIALDWSEKSGDIFPILDRPLTPGCDPEVNLKQSVEAAKFYLDNRSAPNKSILNVLSARNTDEMEWWYKSMNGFDFEGWGHGGHRGNMKAIINGIIFLWKKGEFDKEEMVYHHIFGVSTVVSMVYFAVIQRLLNEAGANVQLTYDSSSFQKSLAHGSLFIHATYTSLQSMVVSNRNDYSKMDPDAKMPCSCSVCREIPSFKEFLTDSPKAFYLLGTLHNLNLVLDYKNFADNIINSGVEGIIMDSFPARIASNIRAIKKAFASPKSGFQVINFEFQDKDMVVPVTNGLDGFFKGDVK